MAICIVNKSSATEFDEAHIGEIRHAIETSYKIVVNSYISFDIIKHSSEVRD